MIGISPISNGENQMTEGLNGIIMQLEHQKAAIDKALTALRDVNGIGAPAETKPAEAPETRKSGMTAEGKLRLVAALKKRWAAKKRAAKKAAVAVPVEAAPAVATTPAPVKRKSTFTPEGRKRLAEAMKRRWAVKRAASAVKKSGRKKAA
jgi:hypothetical protein